MVCLKLIGFFAIFLCFYCKCKLSDLSLLRVLVKKKEVKKETGLGLTNKKDVNFGEWYSEVFWTWVSSKESRRSLHLIFLLIYVSIFKRIFCWLLLFSGCCQQWDDWVLWYFWLLHPKTMGDGDLGNDASAPLTFVYVLFVRLLHFC